MSNSQQKQQKPWSNHLNAPEITYELYLNEKTTFAGTLLSSVFYGMVIILFFKCMAALFDSAHRRGERIKWGLVCYTLIVFSFVTVLNAMDLNIFSISYIDNREFPGAGVVGYPGPFGYQLSLAPALNVIPIVMFALCNWLAGGLLLYRCYVIYSMSLRVIAFPCFMYLGSLATGIVLVYQTTEFPVTKSNRWAGPAYFSISIALNVLLTLAIVIRLILHARNVRTAMGGTGISGLCKAIVTMLVESCAIYAVSSLLVVGPAVAGSPIANVFMSVVPQTQVIASLLIIQRVANKIALTSDDVVSGRMSSFKARSRGELTGGSDALPGGDSRGFVDECGTNSGESAVGVETTTDFCQDEA